MLQWWDDDKASALQSFFCFCSYAYGLIYLEDAWEVATKKKRCTAKSPFFSEIFSKRDFYDFAESMRRLNKLHLILSVDEIYDGDKGDNLSNQYMIIDKSLLKQGVARYDLVRLLDLRQTDIRKAIGYNPNVDDDDEDEEDTSSAFNQVRLVFVGEFMDKAGEQSNVFRRNVSAVPSISAFIMLKGATASATNENTSLIDAFTFVPIAISTSIGMP